MSEKAPRIEKPSSIEVGRFEVAEKEPEKELIDRLGEYVPSIDTIRHQDVARRLVDETETASRELSEEIELAKRKSTLLQTMEAKGHLANIEKGVGEFNFGNHTSKILLFAEIYESENPYEALLSRLSPEELAQIMQENERLSDYQNEFGATKKIISLVWKRSEHERKIKSAQQLAKKIVRAEIEKNIYAITKIVESAKEDSLKPGRRLSDLLRKFCFANSQNIEFATQTLQDGLDSHSRAKENLAILDELAQFVESTKNRCQGELSWYFDQISHSIKNYQDILDSTEYSFKREKESTSATSGLRGKVEKLKNKIRRLFTEPNPHGGSVPITHERENWSITKEFLQAMKSFNGQIKKAGEIVGVSIEEYKNYYFGQIQEAEAISSGRLLTHATPTAMMFQVLERGDLSSVIEQEKKHKTKKRTHAHPDRPELEQKETHDICFNIDSIYRNFSTDEEKIKGQSKIRADMVLIFSENQLLDRRQFVDLDGRHIFDENYSGDTDESPGFSIDLQKTPFMILVSAAEKDKVVDFLKEKSVFKNQLSKLKPEELQIWLEEHLIVTPDIDNFKFTEEVKNRFFQSTRLQPKKGYVELTDMEAGFKISRETTKQFFAEGGHLLHFSRDYLNRILESADFKAEDLVALFEKQFPDDFSSGVGVWENYTLKQHTLMVINQFERYFANQTLPGNLNKSFFRLLLVLHDVGKPKAVQKGEKYLQHTYTIEILNPILAELSFEKKDIELATALIGGDPIGEYIKTGNIDRSAETIRQMADKFSLSLSDFFQLLLVYYKVDAGSYTEDAGGLRSLDSLFNFDHTQQKLQFSSHVEEKIEALRQRLKV